MTFLLVSLYVVVWAVAHIAHTRMTHLHGEPSSSPVNTATAHPQRSHMIPARWSHGPRGAHKRMWRVDPCGRQAGMNSNLQESA